MDCFFNHLNPWVIHHPLLSAEATVTHQYVFFVKRRFSTVSEVISIHINLTVVLKISKCQSLDIFWECGAPNPSLRNMWMQRARVSHKRNRAVLCNGWHSLSHSCGQRPQRGTSDSGLTFLSATSTPYCSFCS